MSSPAPLARLGDGAPLRGPMSAADPAAYWPASTEEIRVVLIKPTDQLLIGNVGALEPGDFEHVAEAFRKLGFKLPVMVFESNITIGVERGQDLEA